MDTPPPSGDSGSPPPPGAGPVPPVQPLPRSSESTARMWAMWCHMSSLAGLVFPFGQVVGPLVIWQMKKGEFPLVDEHGRESLNFQLSALIYLVAGAIAAFIWSLFCFGFLLFPLLGVIWLGSIILSIVAGVKANDGGFYRYPLNLRLVK